MVFAACTNTTLLSVPPLLLLLLLTRATPCVPHSHVNEAADPYAGLMGPIIITTPENAKEDGSPKDIDR